MSFFSVVVHLFLVMKEAKKRKIETSEVSLESKTNVKTKKEENNELDDNDDFINEQLKKIEAEQDLNYKSRHCPYLDTINRYTKLGSHLYRSYTYFIAFICKPDLYWILILKNCVQCL